MISLGYLQYKYGSLEAEKLLRAMITGTFSGRIALLTSFGADAGVLLGLAAQVDKNLPVLFLETGKHFPETLAYGEALAQQFGLTNIQYLRPDPALLQRTDAGGELWQSQPSRCCWLRKVEPLERAVRTLGLRALITGRKRYQTPERSTLETIELHEDDVFRINPLAHWSREDQARVISERSIPPHPLAAQGYRSIGCAPCTLPTFAGEDERAGRWAHTAENGAQKTECGIHLPESTL